MQSKTHFLHIYAALSKEEKEEFECYIKAFYAKYERAQTALTLLGDDPEPNQAFWETELIQPLFPKAPSEAEAKRQVQNIFSDLKRWLLAYLLWADLREQRIPAAQALSLEGLRRRRLTDLYAQAAQRLEKSAGKPLNEVRSTEQALTQWHLAQQQYYFLTPDKQSEEQDSFLRMGETLSFFYELSSIKYACEQWSRVQLRDEAPPAEVLTLWERFKQSPWQGNALYAAYYKLFRLIVSQEEALFFELKKDLFEINAPHVSDPTDQLILFTYMSNYAARKARENDAYLKEAMDLYKKGLELNLYDLEGWFNTGTFVNIVQTACSVESADWVEAFITKWAATLSPDDAPSVTALCRGRVLFEKEQYGKCLEALQDVEFKNVLYHLQVRSLQLRCFYENGDWESLENNCVSLYRFIRQKKHTGDTLKTPTLNFIALMRALVKKGQTQKAFSALLRKKKPVWAAVWFEKKLEALKN